MPRYFMLKVPGADAENGATLFVSAPGYAPWSNHVTPGGNEIIAMLEKEKRQGRGQE